MPGVWVIGNAANAAHKVVHAAASGATAAEAVNEDLTHTALRTSS